MTRLLLLVITLLAAFPTTASAQTNERCFPETGYCISGRIREFWEQNGGLPVFGLPITSQQQETIQGQSLQVQWFERNRLELHPENQRPYDVLLGRLGADRLAQQGRDPFTFPTSAAQPGCRYFQETRHNVCGETLAAWRASGLDLGEPGVSEGESLALFGLPLSDPMMETLSDGKQYSVQWFERARFELHPENQPPFNVLLGLLGNEIRAGGGQAQPPQTSDPCADVPAPVSATIEPRCGPAGTTFTLGVSGFTPNEQVGFWVTLPDGSIFGTVETLDIGPTGGFTGLPLESERDFAPGLYYFVFEGTQSKHQAIAYFKIIAAGAAPQPQPAPAPAPPNPAPAPAPAPGPSQGQNTCTEPVPNADQAPNAPVAITSVDKSDEAVTIQNVSGSAVTIDGWWICSVRGAQFHATLSGSLAPGESRTIDSQTDASIWSNSDRDDGALYNAQGQLVSYLTD